VLNRWKNLDFAPWLSTKANFYQQNCILIMRSRTTYGFASIFVAQIIDKTIKNIIMNKAELIEAIAAAADISKADAKKALDAFVSATSGALKAGGRVSLVGFGSFSVSKRDARTGRNPQTGKEIQIAAKNVVRFKAGSELSDAVK